MSFNKQPLGINVLEAARQRISWAFDTFEKISVSFSGGKDSTVMTHLVAEEAQKRGREFALLFIDLEGQYKYTIDHIHEVVSEYSEITDLHWVCLPIHLRNAVSVYDPFWVCWDPDKQDRWIRNMPELAICDESFYPFFKHGMEFEEFVPEWGRWYADGKTCACFVGIRTDESLNRYRTIKSGKKTTFDGRQYTTWCGDGLFNIYPIYDWRTSDIWVYHGKTGKSYNRLYDMMHRAGLSIHQQRICQPYGDDQRKGLWLFHLIEPETWTRIVARVNGANSGSLYAQDSGNITGSIKITLPEGHTWKSFANMILKSLPEKTRDHYEDKIAVYLHWWKEKEDIDPIPDVADRQLEADRKVPSWRRVCKVLLRNDYWCKGLSFGQTKSESYEKYKKLMKKRRAEWQLI
jgi:predicted phosphoadenosine phosphosulfate sulfurtransferase